MTKNLALLILLMSFFSAYAADADTVLSCDGSTKSFGINRPKDSSYIDSNYESSGDMITISADKKWATGLILYAEKMDLCKKTATEYVYSSHCSANEMVYIDQWTSMHGELVAAEALMFKSYGTKGLEMEVLRVNRINLSITDKYLDPQGAIRYNKSKDNKLVLPIEPFTQFWVRINDYQGTCKIATAKL